MATELETIVTDEEIEKAWGYANFGSKSKRDVIKHTLLKRASFWHCGHTAAQICIELGLLTKKKKMLTQKGGRYLWEAFKEWANY